MNKWNRHTRYAIALLMEVAAIIGLANLLIWIAQQLEQML